MNNVNISIVIPTFERTNWLIELLKSLDSQVGEFEVIAIDDGSTKEKNKKDLVLAHPWKFPFTYLNQNHQGPGAARNLGIDHAKGEIIVFLDDDTLVAPGWLASIVRGLDEDGNIVAVAGKTLTYHPRTFSEKFLDHTKHLQAHQFREDGSLAYVCTANSAFLRSCLKKVGGFDTKFKFAAGDDMDLGFRLRKAGYQFIYNEDALAYHRQRSSTWEMWKQFFIYGRGSYTCAQTHKNFNTEHVTSHHLVEPMKVLRVLGNFFKQIVRNRHSGLSLKESVGFPMLEFSNHVVYQCGRLYQRFLGS